MPEDSDLFRLPGAGVGLVWSLRQAGIGSLCELAEADAAALAGRLGLVGKLLDLKGWIEVARSETGRSE